MPDSVSMKTDTMSIALAPGVVTDRVTLRSFTDTDEHEMVRQIYSDPDTAKMLPGDTETLEQRQTSARANMTCYRAPWSDQGFGGWAVCNLSPELGPVDDFMGFCGFEDGSFDGLGPELGYGIARPYWGKGLASHIAETCVHWLFSNTAHTVCYAVIFPENHASRRVLLRNGFVDQGYAVDVHNSITRGYGALPLFILKRADWLNSIQM